MLNCDARAVARLEKLYSTPQIVDQRRRLRGIVSARPGESGLDVGCGVAFLACELAGEVAPEGRIAAIDRSPASVQASKLRVAGEHLEKLVEVHVGDAIDLQFGDETFDFVVGAQVYGYVQDVARAIREAARVLRKGGRLVVLESDWDMCIWQSRDRALTRRIIAARGAAQFAHPHLPCELHRHLRAAGLSLSAVQSFSIIETRYDPDSFSMGLLEPLRDAALKQGITEQEFVTWVADLRSMTSVGEWFFCLDRFVFTATK